MTAMAYTEASISREAAGRLIAAAHQGAAEAGFSAAIAVTDVGGHLRAFERDDAAPFLTGDVAGREGLDRRVLPHGHARLKRDVTDPKVAPLQHVEGLVAVGGGYPLVLDGQVVGGLGISGGTHEQDRSAAEAAMAALGFDPPDAD